jgi:hypothetical protein
MADIIEFVASVIAFTVLEIALICVFLLTLCAISVEIKDQDSDDVFFWVEGWSGYTLTIKIGDE